MKKFKVTKVISIICSVIGFILSGYGLVLGLFSIGASGWDALGVLFILPSVIAALIITFDFLISIDKIKKGLVYSCINSFIKICIIVSLIPNAISEYKYELEYGVSNFTFDVIVVVLMTIVTIPSVLNVIKLIKRKKKLKKL